MGSTWAEQRSFRSASPERVNSPGQKRPSAWGSGATEQTPFHRAENMHEPQTPYTHDERGHRLSRAQRASPRPSVSPPRGRFDSPPRGDHPRGYVDGLPPGLKLKPKESPRPSTYTHDERGHRISQVPKGAAGNSNMNP